MENINGDITNLIAKKTVECETMTLAVYNENNALVCFARKMQRAPRYYELYTIKDEDEEEIKKHFDGVESNVRYSKKFLCKSEIKMKALIEKFVYNFWKYKDDDDDEIINFKYYEETRKKPPILITKYFTSDLDFDVEIPVDTEEMCNHERNDFISEEITTNIEKLLTV